MVYNNRQAPRSGTSKKISPIRYFTTIQRLMCTSGLARRACNTSQPPPVQLRPDPQHLRTLPWDQLVLQQQYPCSPFFLCSSSKFCLCCRLPHARPPLHTPLVSGVPCIKVAWLNAYVAFRATFRGPAALQLVKDPRDTI